MMMIPAVTPNAENYESLGDQASRFVNVDDLSWEDSISDGVTFKTLLIDKESGVVTAYLRMEPGASLPDHEHMLIEQTYVMEGSLKCGEGECTAGNFVWRPAGSRHKAWAPNGGLMLAIFQVPNKFFREKGETDMLDNDWENFWAQATNFAHTRGNEALE